ncbi:MAG: glycosyltransferase family A protein [Pseudomonadota bacterium]
MNEDALPQRPRTRDVLLKPVITVVIPHLNQPVNLARCLASLAENTRQPDEIIVVDNGSHTLPDVPDNVTLLQEKTPGPGPARNLGMAKAKGNVLAFLDADCLARFDWLEEAERRIIRADILGGDMRIGYSDPANLTMTEAYESVYSFRIKRYIDEENFAATANLVVRREILEAVGPFGGLHLAEDRDWGQRAVAMGYEISYAPRMRVYHPARRTFLELYIKWDRQMAHDYGEISDGQGRLRWWLKTAAMGLSPLAEISRIAASDRIKGLGPRIKAFVGLCRIRLYRMGRMVDLGLRGRPERLAARWNR